MGGGGGARPRKPLRSALNRHRSCSRGLSSGYCPGYCPPLNLQCLPRLCALPLLILLTLSLPPLPVFSCRRSAHPSTRLTARFSLSFGRHGAQERHPALSALPCCSFFNNQAMRHVVKIQSPLGALLLLLRKDYRKSGLCLWML